MWAAEAAKKAYSLPEGEAAETLKQFTTQSGEQVVYLVNTVRGVTTKAVSGSYTAREALERMLAGSSLRVEQDAKSGALTVAKVAIDPNVPGATPRESDVRPEKVPSGDEKLNVMAAMEVKTSKIDGLNNRGLLQGGTNAALYHDVISHFDFERMGISSLEELFRYIPQTSSVSTSLQAPVGNTSTSGGLSQKYSTIGMRGFSSSQTVILINGRALQRSALGENGGADISRIPLAAIDRVEILPYSGSAIYGAGAIGGAINIILRKDYSGRDLTTYVGTSTEGGATEYRFTYLEGRTFNHGKTSVTMTFNYQHRDALRANQRDYLNRALDRYGPDSTAKNAQGVSIFEQYILPAFAGAPGTILVGNSASASVNDLGIPGAPGVRYAMIPSGTTPAQSLLLTPASFTATAGKTVYSERYGRSILYEPIDSYSLNAQIEHEILKDKLNAYGEFTVGNNRKNYSAPQLLPLTLSETDPLNPFRTNVTPGFVGRPVTLFLDTPDIADSQNLYKDQSARGVVGLKGKISDTWEWSVDGLVDYMHSTVKSYSPTNVLSELVKLSPYADPGPAAPLETRRAVYPILADHTLYPISAADSEKYFDYLRSSTSNGVQYEGNARIMGEVFQLPAGPFRTSVAGKYQDWDHTGDQMYSGNIAWSQLINNGPVPEDRSPSRGTRKMFSGALEISAPVISRKWHPLPVESLDIEGSISRESDRSVAYDEDGTLSDKQSSSSHVVAAKMQIIRDVAVRGSYSEGFYPPDWGAFSAPISTFMVGGYFPDPKRGNTMQFTPTMEIKQGGNPDLKPETAKSKNFGVILTPRFVPGLSLNVDYWRIDKKDAIVNTSFVDIIAKPDSYGFLITRQDPTDAEKAQGWLGRITAVDARAINASQTSTEGFDTRAAYKVQTTDFGSFDFIGNASFVNNFIIKATPTAPSYDTAGGAGPVRWRGNASITWSRSRWSFTVTSRYIGIRSTSTTTPTESYPGASGIDGDHIPSILRWDLQAGYEIPYQKGDSSGSWKRWLNGTKFTVGVLNVFNGEPAFVTDGSGFYNSADDPRQRYVYLQIKKSF